MKRGVGYWRRTKGDAISRFSRKSICDEGYVKKAKELNHMTGKRHCEPGKKRTLSGTNE